MIKESIMKYNCGEHIQFLNYQQELKKQNKSLRTQDPIKYSKLRKYSARISEYLHWSQKNDYLQYKRQIQEYFIHYLKIL